MKRLRVSRGVVTHFPLVVLSLATKMGDSGTYVNYVNEINMTWRNLTCMLCGNEAYDVYEAGSMRIAMMME